MVVLLGVRTGEAGGRLVYVHDAPAAYAQAGPGGQAAGAEAPAAADVDDD